MMDVRKETGVETYVNDDPEDPNPGIIVDSTANRGRALTSEQARALAEELISRADYYDSLTKPEEDVTSRPSTTCGCGYKLIWVGGHWEHDAAPYLWGDDHEPDEPEPEGPAREYWDEEDGV